MAVKVVKVKSVKKVEKPILVGDLGINKNRNLFISRGIDDSSMLVHNCWGLISKDPSVGAAFQLGKNAKIRYRQEPTPEKLEVVKAVGDIHKVNYNFFTGVPIDQVTKEQRQESKAISFGSIYGKGTPSLARDLGKDVEYAEKLLKNFFAKFPNASRWLTWTRDFSRKNYYTFSPLGRRRNLFGYMVGNKTIDAALERRAQNAPVQGFGSDLMFIGASIFCRLIYEAQVELELIDPNEHSPVCPIGLNVMVHDSLEVETPTAYIPLVAHLMEFSTTIAVTKYVKKYFDYDFVVDTEVDFDIGASGNSLNGWDYTEENLIENIRKGLEYQNSEFNMNIDIEREMRRLAKTRPTYQHIIDRYSLNNTIIE